MSRQDDLQKLIASHTRRLQKLHEQEAGFGPLHTPAHILTEIEDTEVEIAQLQAELAELERKDESPRLTDKQKELLRKMVALKKVGAVPYPFSFGQGLKTRTGTIIIGAEDIEFDFEDCQALIDAKLLRSNGSGSSKTYSITNLGSKLVESDFDLAQPSAQGSTPQPKIAATPAAPPIAEPDPKLASLRSNPRIFLSHASEDKHRVKELYQQLKQAGYSPWLDKFDLLPGQDWWTEIEKIIRNLDNLVVVCLTCNSVTKKGIFQKEIKRALNVLDQMPEDTIYLIPIRLEDCLVPDRLSKLHWVDLFEPDGFEYLKRALDSEIGKRQPPVEPTPVTPAEVILTKQPQPKPAAEPVASAIPRVGTPAKLEPTQPAKKKEAFEPELILISAGDFLMGSNPKKDKQAEENEQPQHKLYLPDYYIAKTPVTNAQYVAFVQATGQRSPIHWQGKGAPSEKVNHPVVNVSWKDAVAYCRWLAKTTGKVYRLPTEAEWEKAARGPDGRIYPWGNKWEAKRCNTREGGKTGTTPVGVYPEGASPYGLLDMAGNVWEWCATKWDKPYPYDVTEDEWSDDYLKAGGDRVLRGGSWYDGSQYGARCADRGGYGLDYRFVGNGFRVAVSVI